MVNRFETPAEAQFINYYTPIPFDDMMKVGLLKQARIDQDQADQEKMLTEYSSFQTAPGADERRRDEIINQMRGDIGKIQGQPGYAEWKQNFSNLRSKYASDPEIMDLKRNAAQYTALAKNAQDAQEKGITRANQSELQNKMQDYYNYGRAGLRDKTGSGQLTPSSYYANVDTREELKKWVNDVKPSSVEQMYNDKTGQYTITQKNAGITMNALGAPYGVQFKQIYENGKPVMKIDRESFDRDGFKKIMNSTSGMQIARDAKQNLQDQGVPVSAQNLDAEERRLALSNINSIMQEKVSSESSMKFAADDYAKARFTHNLTDTTDEFTFPMPSDAKGSVLGSSQKIDAAKTTIDTQIAGVKSVMAKVAEEHGGIKERVETFTGKDGKKFTRTFYEGSKGEDVTDEINKHNLELESFNQQKADIQNLEAKTKKEAGITADYVPNVDDINAAKEAGMNAVSVIRSRTEGYNTGTAPKEMDSNEQKIYDKAYKQTLNKLDPKYAKYENLLEANSKNKVVEIGVTRFASKALNDEVENDALRYFTENEPGKLGGGVSSMNWVQEGKQGAFDNKDYENISNGLPPRFLGYAVDQSDGSLKFIYRFQTKKSTKDKPEYTNPIKVDAPDGVAQKLIKGGKITAAELYLSKVLSNAALGVDRANEEIKMPGFDDKYQIAFETLDAVDAQTAPAGSEFKIKMPEKNTDGSVTKTVKYYTNKQDAITDIISYYKSVDNSK